MKICEMFNPTTIDALVKNVKLPKEIRIYDFLMKFLSVCSDLIFNLTFFIISLELVFSHELRSIWSNFLIFV